MEKNNPEKLHYRVRRAHTGYNQPTRVAAKRRTLMKERSRVENPGEVAMAVRPIGCRSPLGVTG